MPPRMSERAVHHDEAAIASAEFYIHLAIDFQHLLNEERALIVETVR